MRMSCQRRLQPAQQIGSLLGRLSRKIFAFDDVERTQGDGTSDGMRAVREAVEEGAGAMGDRFGNICANHDCT